jgi:hypothetical protein
MFFAREHPIRMRPAFHHHRRRPRNLELAKKYDHDDMQRLKGQVRKIEAMEERSKMAHVVGNLKKACAPTTVGTLFQTASSGRKVGVVVSLVALLLAMMPMAVGLQPIPTQQVLPALNQVRRRVQYVVRSFTRAVAPRHFKPVCVVSTDTVSQATKTHNMRGRQPDASIQMNAKNHCDTTSRGFQCRPHTHQRTGTGTSPRHH